MVGLPIYKEKPTIYKETFHYKQSFDRKVSYTGGQIFTERFILFDIFLNFLFEYVER